MKVLVTHLCLTLGDPMDPLPMGFSRKEHWSGLPLPSPGYCPNPGVEPRSPASQVDSLLSEAPGFVLFTLFAHHHAHNFDSFLSISMNLMLHHSPAITVFVYICNLEWTEK